jgi:hypothetical protein
MTRCMRRSLPGGRLFVVYAGVAAVMLIAGSLGGMGGMMPMSSETPLNPPSFKLTKSNLLT